MTNLGYGTTGDLKNTIAMAKAGITYVDIPYEGTAPAIVGLLRGDGDFMITVVAVADDYVQKGDLRPILTFTEERLPLYPDVESLGELDLLPNPAHTRALMTAAGTPEEIRQMVEDAFVKASQDPEFRAWAEKSGHTEMLDLILGKDVLGGLEGSEAIFNEFKDVMLPHLTREI